MTVSLHAILRNSLAIGLSKRWHFTKRDKTLNIFKIIYSLRKKWTIIYNLMRLEAIKYLMTKFALKNKKKHH